MRSSARRVALVDRLAATAYLSDEDQWTAAPLPA